METKAPAPAQSAAVALPTAKLFEAISSKITTLLSEGQITTPPNYDAGNAMRSAWLHLQDMKDKNDKPVLEVCSQASIANALMKMVIQGMSVAKAQCYFIPYGKNLNYQRSYMGSYALAKRVSNLKEVNAVLIYDGDVFSYDIDTKTGRLSVVEHSQKFENINADKIKGGYAICVFEDGTSNTEIMTMAQIEKAWGQGQTKGQSPAHKNFKDEMAKKSIRARAVKLIINSSDDSDLMGEDEEVTPTEVAKEVVKSNANKTSIDITEIPETAFEEVEQEAISADNAEPTPLEPSTQFEAPKPLF